MNYEFKREKGTYFLGKGCWDEKAAGNWLPNTNAEKFCAVW